MHSKVILSNVWRSGEQIDQWANQHNEHRPIYVSDSQDLAEVSSYFGNRINLAEITGAFVIVGEGDYQHVWVTWSNCPWREFQQYRKVRLYLY